MLMLTIIAACMASSEPVHASSLFHKTMLHKHASIWPSTAAIMRLCLDLQDLEKCKAKERKQSILESCGACPQDVGECEGQDQDALQKELKAVNCSQVCSLIE